MNTCEWSKKITAVSAARKTGNYHKKLTALQKIVIRQLRDEVGK